MADYDVVVIGAGPGGLSAALNLVRARRRTLILDGNRPRNAATLLAHGYLGRDSISPLELRKIGRDEIAAYPDAEFQLATVSSVTFAGREFRVEANGVRGSADRSVTARAIVIATGIIETLPSFAGIRAFYGTSLHSCIECDGYEERDKPLALIGETDDLAEHAQLLSQWTDDLIVFTNGIGVISEPEESALAAKGIRIERRPIDDVVGGRDGLTGVLLHDGTVIERSGGFLRPIYTPSLGFVDELTLDTDDNGFLVVDGAGRTSIEGVYAAGDSTSPGPQQLIVAAGAGAKTAAAVNRDLLT